MATSENKMADTGEKLFIGKGEQPAWLTLGLANRHGLVTGATGTGKTVSLQVMAEGFARAGVPVFAADIKGDLSGIAEVGEAKDFILKRAAAMGLTFQPDQFSTVFWDVFGEQGHPVRASLGNGAAAALPHDGPNDIWNSANIGVADEQDCCCDEGSAGDPVVRRGTCRRPDHAIWKRLQADRRTIQRQLRCWKITALVLRRTGAGAGRIS
jgi:hypothetical protein